MRRAAKVDENQAEIVQALRAAGARHKYHAEATDVEGITFESKAEATRYQELRLREYAGEIRDLKLQPAFELQPAFKDGSGIRHRAITYKADFQYTENATDGVVVEDVKGMQTAIFKLKYKMLKFRYPSLDFRIV